MDTDEQSKLQYDDTNNYDAEETNLNILADESDTKQQPEFNLFMDKRNYETNDFKFLIISLALAIIASGILFSLIFKLLVLCRKRKRQTSTMHVMLSMCSAYLLYLIFYCIKIRVYFEGDNITRFHMYDTIDNWNYGSFLCKFVSSLPLCVKLVARLSIFLIVLKRLLNVFDCKCFDKSTLTQLSDDEQDILDSNLASKNKQKQIMQTQQEVSAKERFIKKVFQWPAILVFIFFTWLVSTAASLQLFSSFKLNEPSANSIEAAKTICNSIFKFPEDLNQVSQMYFNYFLYGLVIPCGLILLCLIMLFILQSRCCCCCAERTLSNTSSLTSSKSSTPTTKRQNKSNDTTTNSSSSSSTSFTEVLGHSQTCHKSKSNNLLLWLMFLIHLMTSMPQEIYRYLQLNIDFNDEKVLDEYLTSSMMQPILKAKPYYAFQLLYVSEFAIMPAVFILFFVCSMRRTRPTRSESDSESPNKQKCSESLFFKYMRSIFYDFDLSQSSGHFSGLSKKTNKLISEKETKQAFLTDINIVESPYPESEELHVEAKFPTVNIGTAYESTSSIIDSYNKNVNSNLMHIIQHPSWRINIKQQQQQQQQYQRQPSLNNSSRTGIQLPFNYINTNQ